MNVFLTGGSGFVGGAILKCLQKNGHFIRLATRREISKESTMIDFFTIPEISGDTSWAGALTGVDVVIHAAARVHVMNDDANDPDSEYRRINVDGTLELASQAIAQGVKRFVFISSIKVNGDCSGAGKPFTPEDIPAPEGPYACSKYEAELGLMKLASKSDLEVVIIRPPLVYGKGVKANFLKMMAFVQKGVPLPLASVRNKRSFVGLTNLAEFTVLCAMHPNAKNQIFLVSDGDDMSTPELLKRTAGVIGKRPLLIPFPISFLEFVAKLMKKEELLKRLVDNLQVDITKANKILSWVPKVSYEDEVGAIFSSAKANDSK